MAVMDPDFEPDSDKHFIVYNEARAFVNSDNIYTGFIDIGVNTPRILFLPRKNIKLPVGTEIVYDENALREHFPEVEDRENML